MNNKMSVKIVLISLVLIQSVLVSNNPAVADPLDSIMTVVECEVTITPPSVIISPGTVQLFIAETTCDGEITDGVYNWEILVQECEGSTIDNDGLYTASDYAMGGTDIIQVTDTKNGNITDTAVVSLFDCCVPEVSISPASADLGFGETQLFHAETTICGETLSGTYTWSVDGGTLDTVHGDTVLYTATEEGVYTLTVTDTTYHVTATAIVEILFGGVCFLDIFPDTLLRSRWITLPAWIIIPGNCHNTNFDAATTVEFWETASIIKMPKLVINNNHILQLLFLRPSWLVGVEYEFVEVVVKAGGEVATGDLYIEMLPYPLDEQKELK